MKRKHLSVAIAALLAAGGLWFAISGWRSDHSAFHRSRTGVGAKTPHGTNLNPTSAASLRTASQTGAAHGAIDGPKPSHTLRPPNQTRRFADFTPEERVEFARKGRGPGG
jgi:hypothetical protein